MAMCQQTSAPVARAQQPNRPYEVRIGDRFFGGDGSPESIEAFFAQLPEDFQVHILRCGSGSHYWSAALDDMVYMDAPPGYGIVRMEYVEGEDGGWLYYAGQRQGPRAFIWNCDLELTVTWYEVAYRFVMPLPVVEFAAEFFAQVLPTPAQSWWFAHGGTPLSFYALVHRWLTHEIYNPRNPATAVCVDFRGDTVAVMGGATFTPAQLVDVAGAYAAPLEVANA